MRTEEEIRKKIENSKDWLIRKCLDGDHQQARYLKGVIDALSWVLEERRIL